MKVIIIILLVLGLFVSAKLNITTNERVRPENFSFKIIGMTDNYDSKTSLYTRNYSSKDSSIRVLLNESDWITIFDSFEKSDFMNFPKEFECSKDSVISLNLPAFVTTIEIAYNGTDKKVTNTTYCDSKIEQIKSEKFNALYSIIRGIVVNKPEVKKMRNCDLEFY